MPYMIKENLLIVGHPRLRRAVARRPFSKGDSISLCPTIQLSASETRRIRKTCLKERLYSVKKGKVVFALGYAALCVPFRLRTSYRNARAVHDPKRKVLEIICTKPISQGEKILCSRKTSTRSGSTLGPIGNGKLEVRESSDKGRGLFALRSYKLRAMMEMYPVIVVSGLPSPDADLIFGTVLEHYFYGWSEKGWCVPLGLWILHNTSEDGTSETTNADYDPNYKNRTVTNFCTKAIAKGEEVTIPYRQPDEPLSKLGFAPV